MTAAEENGTDRKKRRSISGSLPGAPRAGAPTSDTTATAKAPTMRVDDQPLSGASMMP